MQIPSVLVIYKLKSSIEISASRVWNCNRDLFLTVELVCHREEAWRRNWLCPLFLVSVSSCLPFNTCVVILSLSSSTLFLMKASNKVSTQVSVPSKITVQCAHPWPSSKWSTKLCFLSLVVCPHRKRGSWCEFRASFGFFYQHRGRHQLDRCSEHEGKCLSSW